MTLPGPPPGLQPVMDSPEAFQHFIDGAEALQGRTRQTGEQYQQELRRIQQEDHQAHAHLVYMYKMLLDKYKQKCDDYDNEVESRRMWHRSATESRRQLEQLELATVSLCFVAWQIVHPATF